MFGAVHMMLAKITECSKRDQETWWYLRALPRTLRVEPLRVVNSKASGQNAIATSPKPQANDQSQESDNGFLQSLCSTIGSISGPVLTDHKLSNKCRWIVPSMSRRCGGHGDDGLNNEGRWVPEKGLGQRS